MLSNKIIQHEGDEFRNPGFQVMVDGIDLVHEPVYESVGPMTTVLVSESINPTTIVNVYKALFVKFAAGNTQHLSSPVLVRTNCESTSTSYHFVCLQFCILLGKLIAED